MKALADIINTFRLLDGGEMGIQGNLSADEFNRLCPIGTDVIYYPVLGRKTHERTVTRSEAWELRSGHVVVKIKGRTGGVSVTNLIILIPEEEKKVAIDAR